MKIIEIIENNSKVAPFIFRGYWITYDPKEGVFKALGPNGVYKNAELDRVKTQALFWPLGKAKPLAEKKDKGLSREEMFAWFVRRVGDKGAKIVGKIMKHDFHNDWTVGNALRALEQYRKEHLGVEEDAEIIPFKPRDRRSEEEKYQDAVAAQQAKRTASGEKTDAEKYAAAYRAQTGKSYHPQLDANQVIDIFFEMGGLNPTAALYEPNEAEYSAQDDIAALSTALHLHRVYGLTNAEANDYVDKALMWYANNHANLDEGDVIQGPWGGEVLRPHDTPDAAEIMDLYYEYQDPKYMGSDHEHVVKQVVARLTSEYGFDTDTAIGLIDNALTAASEKQHEKDLSEPPSSVQPIKRVQQAGPDLMPQANDLMWRGKQ